MKTQQIKLPVFLPGDIVPIQRDNKLVLTKIKQSAYLPENKEWVYYLECQVETEPPYLDFELGESYSRSHPPDIIEIDKDGRVKFMREVD